jgi:KDO2-lipid IV(A) lauroyltransferase
VLGTGVEVPFFGAPARLPIGPAILARRSGATLLWASGVRGPGGRSRGAFVEVQLDWGAGEDGADGDGEREGDAAAPRGRPRGHGAIARALRPVVRLLEEQIAAHPDQWVAALAPIWTEAPPREAEVAAMTRAARR